MPMITGSVLTQLGYCYEDLVRTLGKLRGELLRHDMLMDETLKRAGVEANYLHLAQDGRELGGGQAELHLYETALVTITEGGDPLRIPYSDIDRLENKSTR